MVSTFALTCTPQWKKQRNILENFFFFSYFWQICIHINISWKKLNRCYLTNKTIQDSDAGDTIIFGNTTCIKHITNVQLTVVGCKETDFKVRGRCSHYLTFYSGPKEDIQLHPAATGKGLQHLSQLGWVDGNSRKCRKLLEDGCYLVKTFMRNLVLLKYSAELFWEIM